MQERVSAPVEAGSEELPIGRIFGGYRIISAIQRGGMGELFLAERVTGNREKVVLKRLLADYLADERYVRMFLSEAKVMSSLDHPNIVKVIDVPVIDEKQCLAMEYVQGRNLAQILRRCRELNTAIPAQAALSIICEVLRGLDYAHNFVLGDGRPLGLVHRDVTPGNILISFDGEVKITDFGISKSEMSSVSTTVGVVKGTTRYLSPEQIRGQPATPRSDLFSASVVLVEALTGHALFDHGTVPPTLFAIVTGQRPPIAELLPFDAPKLAAVLERALDLNADRRHESADDLRKALDEARRQIGRPMDAAGLGSFVKELFRGSDSVDYEDDDNPWHLDAMDLTYLFEVQEVNAFKSQAATPFGDRSDELERVRALLKQAVPGASPLDASQFEASSRRPSSLAAGLSSPTGLRPSRRQETRLDRAPLRDERREAGAQEPRPGRGSARAPDTQPSPVAQVDDLFGDKTQAVEAGMVEGEAEDLSGDKPGTFDEVKRISMFPEPEPALEELREESLDEAKVMSMIPEPKLRGEIITPGPARKPARTRPWALLLAFLFGATAGAFGWARGHHLLSKEVVKVVGAPSKATGSSSRIRPLPHPPVVYPSVPNHRAVAYEGTRPGARLPKPEPAIVRIFGPRGARVSLDGIWAKRRLPIRKLELAPGKHRIGVFKRRYKRVYDVELLPGQRIELGATRR